MKPERRNTWQPNSAGEYLAPLEEYRYMVSKLFPKLPKRVIDRCFMFPSDALTIGYFLEHYPRRVFVVEVGAFVGASAFFFAKHPKVSRVVSVDPNLTLSDELTANSDVKAEILDFDSLKDVKAFDVARTVLAKFGKEREKIELREGVVGSTQTGARGMTAEDSKRVEIPEIGSQEESLVAFVDRLNTKEGVRAALEAIFERNPRAVVFLDDCRHGWGPFVQAGAVDFMERAPDEYHFQLVGDLGPGLTESNLGVLYPDSIVEETRQVLKEVSREFSLRLDPLRLLRREEELISVVNKASQELQQVRRHSRDNSRARENNGRLRKSNYNLRKRNSALKECISDLEQQNSHLTTHYSSRRYRLADILANGALGIPGLGSLLRRRKQPPPS